VNTLSALRSITNASREKRINTSFVALKKNKKTGKLANWQPKFEIEFQVRKIPYR
jgi:hypothetical protein